MSGVEAKAKPEVAADNIGSAAVWSPGSSAQEPPRRRLRVLPLLITLGTIAIAEVLGREMWDAYMGAPWTRDGTVRAYRDDGAGGRRAHRRVAGRRQPARHKGDLLLVIDPINFKIAVSLA